MKIYKALLLSLMIATGTLYAESAKVVYDLTSGDSAKIEKHLIKSVNALAAHYKKEKIEFEAIVVISGDAYKYFIEDLKNSPYANQKEIINIQPHFKPLLKNLSNNKHITFNMCSTGMKARDILRRSLYDYVHADAMKSVYLIKAQNDGYAYMPIH